MGILAETIELLRRRDGPVDWLATPYVEEVPDNMPEWGAAEKDKAFRSRGVRSPDTLKLGTYGRTK